MQKDLHPEAESFTRNHAAFLALAAATGSKVPDKRARMAVFFAVLRDLPPLDGMAKAKLFVDSVLNCIEDTFSSAAFDVLQFKADGRLYPAGEDFRRKMPTVDVACYWHIAHASYFGVNGSFRISERLATDPQTLIDRAGSDGKTIGDLLEEHHRTFRSSG